MIVDTFLNWSKYFDGALWDEIHSFIRGLNEFSEAGRYVIDEDDVYAGIDVYTTKKLEDARFEAHKKYVDIQFLLKGHEQIGYSDIEGLIIDQPYIDERDVMFFEKPDEYSMIDLKPGYFALFMPEDAHMPCVNDANEEVKKVVIKIKSDLVNKI